LKDSISRGEKILEMISENEDILNKAYKRVSRFVHRDDLLSEIFMRLDKHLDISRIEHRHQFRQYFSKVAYQVSAGQLKMHAGTTKLVSVRAKTYEEIAKVQEMLFARARADSVINNKSHRVDRCFEDIDFYETINEKLSGDQLDVALLLSKGYNISKVSEILDIPYSRVRNNIIPAIRFRIQDRHGA
jgi:DNA-directed RNA polymerase specialized sigma24 family protein